MHFAEVRGGANPRQFEDAKPSSNSPKWCQFFFPTKAPVNPVKLPKFAGSFSLTTKVPAISLETGPRRPPLNDPDCPSSEHLALMAAQISVVLAS
jgi:hypothetical protein